MPKLLKGLLLFTLLAGHTVAATVFDVEVIIFTRPDTSDESWPDKAPRDGKTQSLLVDKSTALCAAPCDNLPSVVTGDMTAPTLLPAASGASAALGDTLPGNTDRNAASQPDNTAAAGDASSMAPAASSATATNSDSSDADSTEVLPRLLNQNELALNAEAKALTRLPGAKVILHTGWRLAPVQPRYAVPMAVIAGRNLPPPTELMQPAEALLSPALSAASSTPLAATSLLPSPLRPELSGDIQVALDHYLLVDMALKLDVPQADGEADIIKTLRQKRRLKSGELHYFDNPAMGVLMQIRPVR